MHPTYFFNFSTHPFAWVLFAPLLALIVIWTIVWKGLALWRAAQRRDIVWFVVLLVVNTLGVLEIIYLLTAGKKRA
jgi:hypothetical protein